MTNNQGRQYGTVRLEFVYYVPRTLNRTVPAYRNSVQFLKRTVPTYRTRTITKNAYRTSVPYFLAKIEAYRTVPTYRTSAILANNIIISVKIFLNLNFLFFSCFSYLAFCLRFDIEPQHLSNTCFYVVATCSINHKIVFVRVT